MSDFDIVAARKKVLAVPMRTQAKILLLALLEHMPHCFPGLELLVTETGCSRRQLINELHSLELANVIRITRTFGRGNRYDFIDGWENVLPVQDVHQCRTCTSAPDASPPVHPMHGGSAPAAPLPVHPMHPKREVKRETKREDLRGNARARAAKPKSPKVSGSVPSKPETEYPDDFAPLPRHVEFSSARNLNLELEVIKFRGNHESKGHKFKDWHRALDTWLAKSIEFAPNGSNSGPRKSAPQGGSNEHVEVGQFKSPKAQLKLVEVGT